MTNQFNDLLLDYSNVSSEFIKFLIHSIPNFQVETIYLCLLNWSLNRSLTDIELNSLYQQCVPLFKLNKIYFDHCLSFFQTNLITLPQSVDCVSFIFSHCLKQIKTQKEYEDVFEFLILFCFHSKFFDHHLIEINISLHKTLNEIGKTLLNSYSFPISTKLLYQLMNHYKRIRDIHTFNFGLKHDTIYSFSSDLYLIQTKHFLKPVLPILNKIFYNDLVNIISPYIHVKFNS